MTNRTKELPQEDLDHILEHTRELWNEARGKSFFITGGTGFFGRWLVRSFCDANDTLGLGMKMTVISRQALRSGRDDVQLIHGDLLATDLPPGRFDYVIHAAYGPMVYNTTSNVMEFARSAKAQSILFTSSGAVYGDQPLDLEGIPESHPCSPCTDLGYEKRIAEITAGYRGAKIARCFTFVGPHLPLNDRFAIGNFMADALKGGPIRLSGGAQIYRSYLYAADMAIWLWTILFRGQASREYNVGSPEGVTITQLALEVGGCAKTEYINLDLPKDQMPNRYVPSIARAEKELGLNVWINRQDAIRRTLAWLG